MEMFDCPTCGSSTAKCFAALSRLDNETRLCGRCGSNEGLMEIYRNELATIREIEMIESEEN